MKDPSAATGTGTELNDDRPLRLPQHQDGGFGSQLMRVDDPAADGMAGLIVAPGSLTERRRRGDGAEDDGES